MKKLIISLMLGFTCISANAASESQDKQKVFNIVKEY